MIPLLSGLLTALSLPTAIGPWRLPDLGFLGWISLVPLFLSLRGGSVRAAFLKGLLFGAGYYALSLYWIFIALRTYGEVPLWGSLLGVAAATLIEALFLAGGMALAVFAARRGGPLWIIFPLAWVVQDFARTCFPFGGFPWASLGYSQGSFLPILQILDLTGIYGVTFLLAFSNAVMAEVISRFRNSFPKLAVVLFLVVMVAALLYGRFRLADLRGEIAAQETIKVVLVQGNIPQDEKWQEENFDEIIAKHIALSEEAMRGMPDLLVWPEAAFPAVIPPDLLSVHPLHSFRVPLLTGAVTYEGVIPEEWPPSLGEENFALHNSALLIEPGGLIAGRYDKNHLVPMGEYVPLGRLLFFLNKIVPAVSSFSPGKGLNLMAVRNYSPNGSSGPLRFGVTICYEDLFPEISRTFTRTGADFLVNLTNDAWYERSSAVFQHFDFSRFRAIENRRSLVRATNTGVSGVFNAAGEVVAEAPVFEEAVLTAEIPLGDGLSFYTRFGDLFAWGCVVFVILIWLLSKRRNYAG